jgi:acyl-CoA dehydrogenase
MTRRALERTAFGKRLYEHGPASEWIALSRLEIEQARLLVLKTAWLIDHYGVKAAHKEVAMIKVVVPRIQTAIANRAIQTFGAAGLTNDTPLAFIWTWGRALQFADGPDEVHLRTIARNEIKSLA